MYCLGIYSWVIEVFLKQGNDKHKIQDNGYLGGERGRNGTGSGTVIGRWGREAGLGMVILLFCSLAYTRVPGILFLYTTAMN